MKFNDELIDDITYKTADRCRMETIIKNTNGLTEDFLDMFLTFKTHSFIANQQNECCMELRKPD